MNTTSEQTQTLTNETSAEDLQHLSLQVGGMTCASCVSRVEKVLLGVPGVGEAVVNLANERASVAYRAGEVDPDRISAAIETAGYSAHPVTGEETDDRERAAREEEMAGLRRDLLLAAAFTVPLFLIAMLKMAPGVGGLMMEAMAERGWMGVEWLLATPVQFWAGRQFYTGAWGALKHRTSNMNTLIALGTSVAYGYSAFVTVFGGLLAGDEPTYFDTSAMIIGIILIGRLLEARAKGGASDAIRSLMSLQARTARVVRDGEELDRLLDPRSMLHPEE